MIQAKDRMTHVDLGRIKPNPWQVERPEDPEGLEELAQSILAYGMIETPPARPTDDGAELGSGHRRLAAHKLLVERGHQEFSRMRVHLRELTDEQMADIVIQENQKRKDLNPIAVAKFYERYLEDFNVTQTVLAERVGCSQAEIANTLQLLKLPDEAKEMVIARAITPRHGREILRAARVPEAQKAVVATLKKEPNTTVEELHQEVDRVVAEHAKPLDSYWQGESARFDVTDCKSCKDRFTGQPNPWNDQKKAFCLNPECWNKKQEEFRAAKLAEAIASGEGDIINDLGYGNYEELAGYNLVQITHPEECPTCEHRKQMKRFSSVIAVCTDLKCFRKKKRAKTIEGNKRKADEDLKLTERIEAAFKKAEDNPALWRELDLMILEAMLRAGFNGLVEWFLKTCQISLGKEKRFTAPDRLPSLLKDTPDIDLHRLQPQMAMQILRFERMDRVNHYLRKLEGGPETVTLKHPDGTESGMATDEIYLVKHSGGRIVNQAKAFRAYYRTGEVTGSTPIMKESYEELVSLGIKSEWDYSSREGEEEDKDD